jgi:hypothetical protein
MDEFDLPLFDGKFIRADEKDKITFVKQPDID